MAKRKSIPQPDEGPEDNPPSLHSQLGPRAIPALQGIMHQAALKYSLPEQFTFRDNERGNGVILTNTKNGKSVEVGLYAWGDVRQVLSTLLPD